MFWGRLALAGVKRERYECNFLMVRAVHSDRGLLNVVMHQSDSQSSSIITGVGLFVLVIFGLVFIHQTKYDSFTPCSRLALLHSILENKTLAIDRLHWETTDKATFGGHYYSDKAPGTVALALPAFFIATLTLETAHINLDSDSAWLLTSWVACAFSQALPAALGALALFFWLRRQIDERSAMVTVLGFTLGSLSLPYSTLLFSHAQTIGLLSVAIWAIDLFESRTPSRQRMMLAGFSTGLALASEYTAGLVVVAIGIYVLVRRKKTRLVFILSAACPLLLVPLYSLATLGNPFTLPYSYQACFSNMSKGLYAIGWPNLENFGRLLIGPTRGLVFWTPFLVMAWVGVWSLAKDEEKTERWWRLWLVLALPMIHVLVISGRTWDWQAGNTLSARYMAPILPLLALPCAKGVQRLPNLGCFLAVCSVAITTIATLTDACPDYSFYSPLTEFHIPLFLNGEFSPNLGMALGLSPFASVALYYLTLVAGAAWLWQRLPVPHT